MLVVTDIHIINADLAPDVINNLLGVLTDKEQFVIKSRFYDDNTLSQTAQSLNALIGYTLSEERIGEIEAKALRKLRMPAKSRQVQYFMNF
jgi:DNA-directed RNA polymerase sigma subunit (sigma70/sigma32)